MTTFRGIEVVAVPATGGFAKGCSGCIVYETSKGELFHKTCEELGLCDSKTIVKPASLHDGRPRVVLMDHKPSFPVGAVWHRDGARLPLLHAGTPIWGQSGSVADILAVERADEGEESA